MGSSKANPKKTSTIVIVTSNKRKPKLLSKFHKNVFLRQLKMDLSHSEINRSLKKCFPSVSEIDKINGYPQPLNCVKYIYC